MKVTGGGVTVINELVPLIVTILYSASWYAIAGIVIVLLVLAWRQRPSYQFGEIAPAIKSLIISIGMFTAAQRAPYFRTQGAPYSFDGQLIDLRRAMERFGIPFIDIPASANGKVFLDIQVMYLNRLDYYVCRRDLKGARKEPRVDTVSEFVEHVKRNNANQTGSGPHT